MSSIELPPRHRFPHCQAVFDAAVACFLVAVEAPWHELRAALPAIEFEGVTCRVFVPKQAVVCRACWHSARPCNTRRARCARRLVLLRARATPASFRNSNSLMLCAWFPSTSVELCSVPKDQGWTSGLPVVL